MDSKFTQYDFKKPGIFVSPDLTPKLYPFRPFRGKEGQASRPETRKYIFMALDPKADEDAEKIALTLAEAEEKAIAIREAAQAEAAALREQAANALAEAEQIKARSAEEGRAAGMEQGLAEGRAQGHQQFENDVAPVLGWFEKVQSLYNDLWASNEPTLVALATQIAERVVLKELSTPRELITAAFKAALDHLQEQHQAMFRVHPEDLAHLETLRDLAREKLSGLTQLGFESDPNLARGDLVMETESGRLDATIKQRLAAVTEAINDALVESFNLDW